MAPISLAERLARSSALAAGDTGRVEGKLRLRYEAAPMALIVEQAGAGPARAGTGS